MEEHATGETQTPLTTRRLLVGWIMGCLSLLVLVIWGEWSRIGELDPEASWLFDLNIDSTPYAIWLLLLPIAWLAREPLVSPAPRWWQALSRHLDAPRLGNGRWPRASLCGGLIVMLVAALAEWRVAQTRVAPDVPRFGKLPPAFHDEFSYAFQAQTFRAGRWAYPSHPTAPRLFDQMHVLNEGQFASRYFPGAGLWAVPFVAGSNPYTGNWLATVIIAGFVWAIGRELGGNGLGLVAGLLTALSPGIDLFGATLLAHQPTLVGLGLFLWSSLRLMRTLTPTSVEEEAASTSTGRATLRLSVSAGIGLTFAMLCRPMTAAGIGLPVGIWLAVWLGRTCLRRRDAESSPDSLSTAVSRRLARYVVLGFAVPLVTGFAILMWQNVSITGSWLKSPYGLYTELFTPRHQYGFHNVTRALPLITDRVLEHYDQWAENLTLTLALRNVGYRLMGSWVWSIGLAVIVVTSVMLLTTGRRGADRRWWLIPACIASLHLLHVPYWFDGILHWHYVFESGPLWCLLVAASVGRAREWASRLDRPWLAVWWIGCVSTAVAVNQFAVPPFWSVSRLEAGVREFAFARIKQFELRSQIAQIKSEFPLLVLIRHDPSDRHIDYVSNHPGLRSSLLLGRIPTDSRTSEEDTLRLARTAFPDRAIYVFDIATRRLQAVSASK